MTYPAQQIAPRPEADPAEFAREGWEYLGTIVDAVLNMARDHGCEAYILARIRDVVETAEAANERPVAPRYNGDGVLCPRCGVRGVCSCRGGA